MKKFTSLFLMFSIVTLSIPLTAKEKKGADLIIQNTDGTQVKGELIAVKQDSLLLLERDSGTDLNVDIKNVGAITVLQKLKFLKRVGLGVLVFAGLGALSGYLLGERNVYGSQARTAAKFAVIGSGIGFLTGILHLEKGKNEVIQIEGKSEFEILVILGNLNSQARIKKTL